MADGLLFCSKATVLKARSEWPAIDEKRRTDTLSQQQIKLVLKIFKKAMQDSWSLASCPGAQGRGSSLQECCPLPPDLAGENGKHSCTRRRNVSQEFVRIESQKMLLISVSLLIVSRERERRRSIGGRVLHRYSSLLK